MHTRKPKVCGHHSSRRLAMRKVIVDLCATAWPRKPCAHIASMALCRDSVVTDAHNYFHPSAAPLCESARSTTSRVIVASKLFQLRAEISQTDLWQRWHHH